MTVSASHDNKSFKTPEIKSTISLSMENYFGYSTHTDAVDIIRASRLLVYDGSTYSVNEFVELCPVSQHNGIENVFEIIPITSTV